MDNDSAPRERAIVPMWHYRKWELVLIIELAMRHLGRWQDDAD